VAAAAASADGEDAVAAAGELSSACATIQFTRSSTLALLEEARMARSLRSAGGARQRSKAKREHWG
jgi:hypothetical protein